MSKNKETKIRKAKAKKEKKPYKKDLVKKSFADPFILFCSELSHEDHARITELFSEVRAHCLLPKHDQAGMIRDFENAVLYYRDSGVSLHEALARLDPTQLGGFYSRPAQLWFPLDEAAKIYPVSMDHGRMSVFRLSVNLREAVVPALLQMALNFSIKRFPGFAVTIKKGFFWHYLDATKRRFFIEPDDSVPCQPMKVSKSGSQSFRVLYYQNRISIEFFHVLTDGTGGLAFLKVLTAEYLRLLGHNSPPDSNLPDINATPDAEEFANAFAAVPMCENSSGFIDKAAVQMGGKLAKQRPCRVLHLKLNSALLRTAARARGTSVTAYLLAMLFLAGKAATDEYRGPASIQVPVNMRKFYPSKTLRNFSLYCGIRLNLEDISDFDSILPRISAQLLEKAAAEPMREMLTSTNRLIKTIRCIPLLIKQPVAKMIYGFLGDKIFSNTLSNLGVVNFPPALAAQIESMDFVLGTTITNRASCAVISFGDITTLSITKLTADPSFEEKLAQLCSEAGFLMGIEGSVLIAD